MEPPSKHNARNATPIFYITEKQLYFDCFECFWDNEKATLLKSTFKNAARYIAAHIHK